MNKLRRNCKRLSVWILLFTQILLILSYFYVKVDNYPPRDSNDVKISFIPLSRNEAVKTTYHTSDSVLYLKSIQSRESFIDFNSSLCYQNGTDLKSMKRSRDNWQCKCFPGWHGKDCGQPEIVWRAFLTHRKPLKVAGPRTFEKRLICILPVDEFSETLTEIRVNELGGVVDLFILYEDINADFLLRKLNNKFLKEFHRKILYLKKDSLTAVFWEIVKNIKDDDLILTMRSEEIPNKYALNFLKLYDGYPEPVKFRSRWSVFGFFWIHPMKTVITGGACSLSFLKKNLNNKIEALIDNKTMSIQKGMILGDLNHSGGWFCEYCNDITQILLYLSNKNISLENIDHRKIDNAFLEDAIENGIYIDGKTELTRARRYRDNYFAPDYVLEHNFKYDFLLINFYSKIDYYEG